MIIPIVRYRSCQSIRLILAPYQKYLHVNECAPQIAESRCAGANNKDRFFSGANRPRGCAC